MAMGAQSGAQADTGAGGIPVSMKALAQKIAQLQYGGHKADADEYLKKYGGQIDPAYLKAAGVQMPKGKSLFGKITQPVMSVAAPVFNVLGRPAQVLQAGLRTVGVAAAKGIHEATGFGHEVDTSQAGFGQIGKALTGHGDLTPWSMVGSQYSGTADALRQNGAPTSGLAGFGVRALGAGADLAATAAYDPLAYVGGSLGGSTKAAEAGFGVLRGTEGIGETAVQAIRRGGTEALGEEGWNAAKAAIQDSEQVKNMARFGRRAPTGEAELAASQAAKAEKVITALERGGQKGLRVGGKTVVPYGEAAPLKAARAALGKFGKPLDWAKGALRADDEFRTKYGEKLYQAKHASELAMHGATSRGHLDIATRAGFFEKAALEGLPQAERDAITTALDTGTMDTVRSGLSKEGQDLMDNLGKLRSEGYADLGAPVVMDKGVVQAAHTSEDLEQIRRTAFEAAHSKLVQDAQIPMEAAQKEATRLRGIADTAQSQFDAAQIKLMDKSNAEGLGRTYNWGSGKNFGVLRERARVATSEALAAEAKITKTQEKIAAKVAAAPAAAEEAANAARDAAAKAGSFLKEEGTYIPRNVFTPEGVKALKQLKKTLPEAEFTSLTGDLSNLSRQGSTISRVGAETIEDTNNAWLKTFTDAGIKLKDAPLELNPTRLVAEGGRRILDAYEEIKHLSRLSQMVDETGTPLIISGEGAAERAAIAGYSKVPGTKFVGEIYADPVTIKSLTKMNHIIHSDKALGEISKLMEDLNGMWAQQATTFNFAKRYLGDIFNNALDGVTDPGVYRLGQKMQFADAAVQKEIGRAWGPEWEAAIIEKLGAKDGAIYINATKDGATTSGLLSGDVQNRFADLVKGENTKLFGKKDTGFVQRFSRNKIMDVGAKTSRFEEDNVRLANYIHNFRETGSRAIATQHVQDFLFDYNELSRSEIAFKKISRFYTYTRKNTPLQIKMLLDKPGIYSVASKAHGAVSGIMPGTAAKGLSPDYSVARGDIPFLGNMIQTDSPLADAFAKLDPLVQTVAMLPGIGKLLPKEVHPEGGAGEVLRGGFSGLFAGGTVATGTAAAEAMTNTSFLTGSPLSKKDSAIALRLAKAIMPELSKAGPVLNPKGGNIALQLTGKALGLNILPVNPKSMESEVKRRLGVLNNIIDKAKQNDEILPAQQDLIDAGLAPDEKHAKKILAAAGITLPAPKKKRTPSQIRADALAKITA